MVQSFLSVLTGSFSTPARGNPTVRMVEAGYRHGGVDARYINCDVKPEHLAAAVAGARAMGWAGFNCSIPHKVAVVPYLDELTEAARLIGAVNCVAIRDERLVGENTDGKGFMTALRTAVDPRGQTLFMLGAGGAARAIAVEAALAGVASITVANRDSERGLALTRLIQEKTPAQARFVPWDGPTSVPANATLLVNATSIGLYPNVGARPDLDWASLRRDLVVCDVVMNPPRTVLLQEAEKRGCTVLDGLGMLVSQAIIAIMFQTGHTLDAGVMRRTLEELFVE